VKRRQRVRSPHHEPSEPRGNRHGPNEPRGNPALSWSSSEAEPRKLSILIRSILIGIGASAAACILVLLAVLFCKMRAQEVHQQRLKLVALILPSDARHRGAVDGAVVGAEEAAALAERTLANAFKAQSAAFILGEGAARMHVATCR